MIPAETPGATIWDPAVDASCIVPRLWQGSVLRGDQLHARGFDVICLCAKDFQPDTTYFGGLRVIRARLTDGELTAHDWHDARDAGRHVAQAWREGKRVLVACIAGQNRSGLVMALALSELTSMPMNAVIGHVRACRKDALNTKAFVHRLLGLTDAERRVREPLAIPWPPARAA